MKLSIKGERDRYYRIAFLVVLIICCLQLITNVLSASLAWHFYSTQKTITTPMGFNRPFSSDASSADTTAMTMFATSFAYWRLNVSPETIDGQQKNLLAYVPPQSRDALKKALDVEADRIRKGGITTRLEIHELREIDPGIMEVKGILASSTTNGAITTVLPPVASTWRIKMSYEGGMINLLDFSEIVPVSTTTH